MNKLLLAIAIFGGGTILFLIFRSPEPKYQGRSIKIWIDDWAAKRNRYLPEAIKHIGIRVLPYAVHNLALNDSSWRSNYTRLQAKLPNELQKIFPKPKPLLQEVDGANVFFYLGSNSLPNAIKLLKHSSPTVRRAAAWGIGSSRRQSASASQAIPALIQTLTDKDRMVRFHAALALKEMGAEASNAVPDLTRVVADPGVGVETNAFFYLRAAAASALGKVGAPAATALPTLRAALQQPNSYLRGQASVAIWRIDSDVETALPVLLREMPTTSEHSKWDWIIALGEMGPRARQAIPQLRKELENDEQKWVLEYVTNALKRIEPETPTAAEVR